MKEWKGINSDWFLVIFMRILFPFCIIVGSAPAFKYIPLLERLTKFSQILWCYFFLRCVLLGNMQKFHKEFSIKLSFEYQTFFSLRWFYKKKIYFGIFVNIKIFESISRKIEMLKTCDLRNFLQYHAIKLLINILIIQNIKMPFKSFTKKKKKFQLNYSNRLISTMLVE